MWLIIIIIVVVVVVVDEDYVSRPFTLSLIQPPVTSDLF